MAPDARGAIAVYCTDACGPLDLGDIQLRNFMPTEARRPAAKVERWGEEWGMPDQDLLEQVGVGDVAGAAQATQALVVRWAGPRDEALAMLEAVGAAALAAGPWIEDLDTGLVYDRASFRAALDAYRDPGPDVTALAGVTASADPSGAPGRFVTRGLRKAGIGELLVEVGSDASFDRVEAILLATGQAVSEQGLASRVTVDSQAFRAPGARTEGCGVTGEAVLRLVRNRSDDPPAPLSEVTFEGEVDLCAAPAPAAPAPPPLPRTAQGQPMALQAGAEPVEVASAPEAPATPDSTHDLKGPDSLEVIQARALERLRGPVRLAFQAGLPDGDLLLVKVPFQAPDGRVEWLWMQVESWGTDNVLRGTMANEPRLVTRVKRGDPVEAHVDYVFDYLWAHADNSREGNTTGPLVE